MEQKFCQVCGAPIVEGSTVCAGCGEPLDAANASQNDGDVAYGVSIGDGGYFDPDKFQQEEQQAQAAKVQQESERKVQEGALAIIAIIVAVVIIGVIVAFVIPNLATIAAVLVVALILWLIFRSK